MMKHNEKRKRKVSGFTLLEMVVVLAIISVLTGILVPTVRGYITRSRINTANSNAKVLFNSIQTIMMEFQFKERTMTESAFYGTEIYNLTGNDKVFFYVKGENGVIQTGALDTQTYKGEITISGGSRNIHLTALKSASQIGYDNGMGTDDLGNPIHLVEDMLGATVNVNNSNTFGNRLSRLFADYNDVTWAAIIENYTVRGVVCATTPNSKYVGGYPLGMDTKNDDNFPRTIENTGVDDMIEYMKTAWNE